MYVWMYRRDLKPLNCIFDTNHELLKIADFGQSRLFYPGTIKKRYKNLYHMWFNRKQATKPTDVLQCASGLSHTSAILKAECVELQMTTHVGSACWAAPEVLVEDEQALYSLKVDVYSFGIICWQLYTMECPYSDIPGSLLAVEEAVISGTRPKIPEDCPVIFGKLMRLSWHANPDRRPNFDEIVKILAAELEHQIFNSDVLDLV